MKIKPLGFYVLVEMEKVETVTKSGIILSSDLTDKEQEVTETGTVRAIGPTAYAGYPGCDGHEDDIKQWSEAPHKRWGLEIGQRIEYRRFEGKRSVIEGYEDYRYIPDSHIIGAIEDE